MSRSLYLKQFRLFGFFFILIILYSIGTTSVSYAPPGQAQLVISMALAFDFMIFIPLFSYFFIIRKYSLPSLLVLPLIGFGGFLVLQLIPAEHQGIILPFGAVALIAEVSIAGRAITRFVRTVRCSMAQGNDPSSWFTAAFFEITHSKRASKLAGLELSTMFYVFFSWRRKPDIPEQTTGFSYHKESNYSALVFGLLFVTVIETLGVHLFVSRWSLLMAWIFTASSAYMMLWFIGNYRATLLRPILITPTAVVVRSGLHFMAEIPRDRIACLSKEKPDFPKKELMNFGTFGDPFCWIVLNDVVATETAFGGMRKLRALGISPDNYTEFKKILAT